MSKFLSMQWFKSKIENAVERVITKKIDSLMEQEDNDSEETYVKPYKNVKLVNNVLTVVLNDGSIVSKPGATEDDYDNVICAIDQADIIRVMADPNAISERRKQEEEIKRIKALQQGIRSLEGLSDFEIEGNSVKLAGTGRTMPQLLVERFIEIVDEAGYYEGLGNNLEGRLAQNEEYQALKRFFMWCCLNPRAEVANDLYEFLMKNSFRITKQGFFVALRNVVTIEHDNELVQFVSNAYNKVKAVWKKNPNNYEVYLKDDKYVFMHYETQDFIEEGFGEHVGNLTELYLDLPNRKENRFTDAHTRTFDIRVGRVVNMPPEQCNWNKADCGHAGLHFTADHINYVGCGDTSVLILINPMKVVGIGEYKGRCYEYLPIMTVPTEESTTILHDLDFDTLELDEDYAIRELQNLAEKAKEGFVTEAKKHQFNIPAMTHTQIENIVASLDEMKSAINKRVVSLD